MSQRRLIAFEVMWGDWSNGGPEQYIFNSSGDLAPDVVAIAAETGVSELGRIVAEVMRRVAVPFPTDRAVRDRLSEHVEGRFDGLREAFFALEKSVDLHAFMDAYVWDRADDFFLT